MGPLAMVGARPLDRSPINAMDRDPVREPLDTGVRAINALLTVGRGQRIGLFAGSGVGKSVLLGMMAGEYTQADVIVVGLIGGERGREVKNSLRTFWERRGPERARLLLRPCRCTTLVAFTRRFLRYCYSGVFRNQGKHVLLLMDSPTRYAMAQREIALAIGEPPATVAIPIMLCKITTVG